eukprot:m.18935 g.18935  ORF g.18935 m.18935 type:complete len:472 (+) comp7469_c0_seq2:104-1519(+)
MSTTRILFSLLIVALALCSTHGLLVDDFLSTGKTNKLGYQWGTDWASFNSSGTGTFTFTATDPTFQVYTPLAVGCLNVASFGFLHIRNVVLASDTQTLSVCLELNNDQCNQTIAPFPATWGGVDVRRYLQPVTVDGVTTQDVFIPLSHFKISLTHVVSLALKGVMEASPISLGTIEFVNSMPTGYILPPTPPSQPLVMHCVGDSDIALGIDTGDMALAPALLATLRAQNVPATFFVVAETLTQNNSFYISFYRQALAEGHQIALSSKSYANFGKLSPLGIAQEVIGVRDALRSLFKLDSRYVRPPLGSIDARGRAVLGSLGMATVLWDVDTEDWKYAASGDPTKQQLASFKNFVNRGGNLVVAHYFYNNSVVQLDEMITYAKTIGRRFVRMDTCIPDFKDAPWPPRSPLTPSGDSADNSSSLSGGAIAGIVIACLVAVLLVVLLVFLVIRHRRNKAARGASATQLTWDSHQ